MMPPTVDSHCGSYLIAIIDNDEPYMGIQCKPWSEGAREIRRYDKADLNWAEEEREVSLLVKNATTSSVPTRCGIT